MRKNKQLLVEKRYGTVQLESYKPTKDKTGPVLGSFSAKGMAVENIVSQNQTFYSTEVWASPLAFGKGGEYIDENGKLKPTTLMGSVDHPADTGNPDDMLMKLQDAAIVWKDVVRNEDGSFDGTADILNTPHGRIVDTLLEYAKATGGGDIIGVSSRAFGDSEHVNEGYNKIIPESYELLAFDVVYNPSFKNKASLLEGRKAKRKVLTEAIKALGKEDEKHADFYEEYAAYIEKEQTIEEKQPEAVVEESRVDQAKKTYIRELKEEIHKLVVTIHDLDMMEEDEFAERYPNKNYDKLMVALLREKQQLEQHLEKVLEQPEELNESIEEGEPMKEDKILTEATDLDDVIDEFADEIDEFADEVDPEEEVEDEELEDEDEEVDPEEAEEEDLEDDEEEGEEDLDDPIAAINDRLDEINNKLEEIINFFEPLEDFEGGDFDEELEDLDLEDLNLEAEEDLEEDSEANVEDLDLSELTDEELEALIAEEEEYLEKNK